jgi:hypothetical protein
MRRSLFYALLVMGAADACSRAKPSGTTSAAPSGQAEVTAIAHAASLEDSVLAARHRGRLDVVVRPADQPTEGVFEAQVLVLRRRDTVARVTDEHGLASFTSLDVGEHELVVRRVGYGMARALVPIKAGCRTKAEAYIALSMVGIDPPPPRRGRVTITTC